MPPQDKAALFADVATRLSTPLDDRVTAGLVVSLALEVVPAADHAVVTMRSRRNRLLVLAASSELGRALVEQQRATAEGPAWDALSSAVQVRSDDLAADDRWTAWAPGAVSLGVCSVLSFPLVREEVATGVMTLYAEAAGAFAAPRTSELATLYGRHASNALVVARHVSGLRTALESRHVIGMAQGVLMTRFGLDEEQSFAVLKRVSSSQNMKLREVARHVVDTGDLPEENVGGAPGGAVADEVD